MFSSGRQNENIAFVLDVFNPLSQNLHHFNGKIDDFIWFLVIVFWVMIEMVTLEYISPRPVSSKVHTSKGLRIFLDASLMTQVTSYHWEVTPSGCGWTNPSEKYAQVKLDPFPKVKNQNMFETT